MWQLDHIYISYQPDDGLRNETSWRKWIYPKHVVRQWSYNKEYKFSHILTI